MTYRSFSKVLLCVAIAAAAGYVGQLGLALMSMTGSLQFWGGVFIIASASFIAVKGIATIVTRAHKQDQTNPYLKEERGNSGSPIIFQTPIPAAKSK